MAATVIDALVVELGFDTHGMEAGRRELEGIFKHVRDDMADTGRQVEDSSKKAGEFLTRLRNNVIGLFAAFTAGRELKDFVADVTTGDAALGRFAHTIDETAEDIADWRAAGALMGISAQDIDSTFANLTKDFQTFALTGNSSVIPWLRMLGIQIADANGKMVPMGDLFLKLADRFKNMDPARATAIMQQMGISPGMIQIILSGREAVEKLLESQRKFAAAQAADAPNAAKRLQAWADFKNQVQSVGIALLTVLTPALVAVTNALKAIAEFFQAHPELAGAVFGALTAVVLALTAAITAFAFSSAWGAIAGGLTILQGLLDGVLFRIGYMIVSAFPALGEAFAALGDIILATPVGWFLAIIAAIGVTAFELYKHWDTVKKWWHELWGGMGDDAEKGSDRIKGAAQKLKPQQAGGVPLGGDKPIGVAPKDAAAEAWAAAQAAEAKYGIPAAVTFAQWKLESASGTRVPVGSNNPFGIKALPGQAYVDAATKEYVDGQWRTVSAHFAKFDSVADAFAAHARLLATAPAYAEARKHSNDPGAFADALTGVYATDPNYGIKLKALMARAAASRALAPAGGPGILTSTQYAALTTNNNGSIHTSTSSSDTRIGTMIVNSRADDAAGIAGDIRNNLESNWDLVNQANTGQL